MVNIKPEVLSEFESDPSWFHRFEYEIERRRGCDCSEDLWTPGRISVELGEGDRLGVILSTRSPDGRDGAALLAAEAARREALLERLPAPTDLTRTLALAAELLRVLVEEVRGVDPGDEATAASRAVASRPRA